MPPDHVRPDAETLPAGPGAYMLVLAAEAPVPLDIRTLPAAALAPGRYAYVGSARGPGGVRARVLRHLRPHATRHWHIDHLTDRIAVREVAAWADRAECDVVAELLARPGAFVPVPGFGSSDCARCASHLVALP